MSIRLRRPSLAELHSLAGTSSSDALTYAPVGISTAEHAPPGYRLDRWSCVLGRGDHVFTGGVDALKRWQAHGGAGLVVAVDRPPVVGLVVAMAAPLPVGFVEVVCRVVDVVDRPDRFGFIYGTLPIHPEEGEESFAVARASDDSVTFEIVAVSRPRHRLARACPPLARRLQRAATGRYLRAMQAAVAD